MRCRGPEVLHAQTPQRQRALRDLRVELLSRLGAGHAHRSLHRCRTWPLHLRRCLRSGGSLQRRLRSKRLRSSARRRHARGGGRPRRGLMSRRWPAPAGAGRPGQRTDEHACAPPAFACRPLGTPEAGRLESDRSLDLDEDANRHRRQYRYTQSPEVPDPTPWGPRGAGVCACVCVCVCCACVCLCRKDTCPHARTHKHTHTDTQTHRHTDTQPRPSAHPFPPHANRRFPSTGHQPPTPWTKPSSIRLRLRRALAWRRRGGPLLSAMARLAPF